LLKETEQKMKSAAEALEYERAAVLRDQIYELRMLLAEDSNLPPWKKVAILAGEEES
jgi:excinuclease ABC subunit B